MEILILFTQENKGKDIMLVYQTSTGIEMAQNREIQYYTNMLL